MDLRIFGGFLLLVTVAGMMRNEGSDQEEEEPAQNSVNFVNVPSMAIRFEAKSRDTSVMDTCLCTGVLLYSEPVGIVVTSDDCADKIRQRKTMNFDIFAVLQVQKHPVSQEVKYRLEDVPLLPVRHQKPKRPTGVTLVALAEKVIHAIHSGPAGQRFVDTWNYDKGTDHWDANSDVVTPVRSNDDAYIKTNSGVMSDCDTGAPLYEFSAQGYDMLLGIRIENRKYVNVLRLEKEIEKALGPYGRRQL